LPWRERAATAGSDPASDTLGDDALNPRRCGRDALRGRGARLMGAPARRLARLNRIQTRRGARAPQWCAMSFSPPVAAEPVTAPDAASASGGRTGRAGEIALFAVCLAAIACWVGLYRWYGLFENRDRTHFAFEKIPGQFDSPVLRRTLALFLVIAVLYAAGYFIIRRAPRISRAIKFGVAAAVLGPGAINVILYPVGALDVFNYMIEIKLAYHYDVNPYLETFKAFRRDSFALPAFLVDTRLFYGPVWLLVSWLPGFFVGYTDVIHSLLAMKVLNAVLLGLTGLAIFRYHDDERRRWLALYAFLANPLILFEGLANAHNDVMMTCFLVGALVALRGRSGLAGALLAASALVKFFTAALAPLFVLVVVLRRWSFRRVAAGVALAGGLVVLACAPFWAGGRMVDGLQQGVDSSQEMNHVSVYSLAQQYERKQEVERLVREQRNTSFSKNFLATRKLSPDAKQRLEWIFGGLFVAAAVLVLVGVKRGRPPEAAAVDTLILFSLLLTNLYPWYLIPIFAVLALRRDRLGTGYLLVATALGLAYYPFYVWAHFSSGWEKFDVHLFLALFLTVPLLIYLAAEIGRWGIGTAVARRRAGHASPPAEAQTAARRTRVTSSS
jgi:hypothetical protein